MITVKRKIDCPYCGHKNTLILDEFLTYKIIYCDTENGGCDKPFAYKAAIHVTAMIDTFKLDK